MLIATEHYNILLTAFSLLLYNFTIITSFDQRTFQDIAIIYLFSPSTNYDRM